MRIETERMIIRTFKEDDLSDFCKLLEIPEVTGWMMQRHRATEFLQWYISQYENMDIENHVVCLGLFEKDTGCVLGAAGVGCHDDLGEPEIFYQLLPCARGKGFATEAASAITKWAFECFDVKYIIGTAEIQNTASQRVLEKCGYIFEDAKNLLVHVEGNKYDFKYYRCYRE